MSAMSSGVCTNFFGGNASGSRRAPVLELAGTLGTGFSEPSWKTLPEVNVA